MKKVKRLLAVILAHLFVSVEVFLGVIIITIIGVAFALRDKNFGLFKELFGVLIETCERQLKFESTYLKTGELDHSVWEES